MDTKGASDAVDESGKPAPRAAGEAAEAPALSREARHELFGEIAERVDIGVLVWRADAADDDACLRLLALNSAGARMTGVEAPAVIGRLIDEAFPALRSRGIPRLILDVARHGRPLELEEVTYGEVGDVSASYSFRALPVRPDVVTVLLDDVTVRRRAEEALWETTRLRNLVLNAAAEGIVGLSTEGRTTFINPAGRRMLACDDAWVVGQDFHDTVLHTRADGRPFPRADGPIARALSAGLPRRLTDEVFWRADRTAFRAVCSVNPMIDDDEVVGAVLTFRDVTDELRLREELSRRDQWFAALTRHAHDAITVVSEDGTILFDSPAVERLLGWGVEDRLGRDIADTLHPDDIDELRALVEEAARRPGEACRRPLRHRRRDGATVEMESIAVNQIRDDAVGGIIINSRDVTERTASERQLRKTVEELERSNRELERFAHVASHDLQEPLRTVAGLAELLAQRFSGELGEQGDHFIELLVEGCGRMDDVIQGLLSYSRVHTRARPIEPTDAHALLSRVIGSLQAAIADAGAVVAQGRLPWVTADPSQLERVFQNLLVNAIRYRGDDAPLIEVVAEPDGDMWRFTVRDNGPGIEREYQDRIFQMFQRLERSQARPGTGIGLAICKKIVERHGGRIWVESAPGEGAAFHFTMPGSAADDAAG